MPYQNQTANNCLPLQLDHRRLIAITGADATDFLQNVMTGDIRQVADGKMIYALLLTPQGQILHDFFVSRLPDADGYLVDIDGARLDDFLGRLKIFKLRAKVDIRPVPPEELSVFVDASEGLADPRHPSLGMRLYSAAMGSDLNGDADDYMDICTRAGIPDTLAFHMQKDFVADMNLDKLGAIAWDKGCYIGQEVTARMHYKGLAKKRLLIIEGKHIATGDMIFAGERVVGDIRQLNPRNPAQALAIVRLDSVQNLQSAGGYTLTAHTPEYLGITDN